MGHRFYSPLRYPGGKGKLIPFVQYLLECNNLVECDYVEPYAGGSGVALALLYEGFASRIHINDYNRSIHAFWYSVLHHPDELIQLIQDTPVTMKDRTHQQAVQHDDSASPLELGFSTFYLNRVNRSGIIGAGAIGGLAQKGTWKIDARFNKADLIKRLEKISRFSSRIALTCMDAEDFIKHRLPEIPERAFVYLDPPYYVRGKELYTNFYEHDNHDRIAQLVASMHHPWIISYDDVTAIERMYGAYRSIQYRLSYTAGPIPAILKGGTRDTRPTGVELMFFSPSLVLPNFRGDLRPARKPSGIGLGMNHKGAHATR